MQQSSFSGASRCCSRCLCVAGSSNEPFGINFCPYAMPAYTPGTVSLRLSKYVATATGTATAAKEESKQEARQRQQISDITWALNTIRMRIKLGGHKKTLHTEFLSNALILQYYGIVITSLVRSHICLTFARHRPFTSSSSSKWGSNVRYVSMAEPFRG